MNGIRRRVKKLEAVRPQPNLGCRRIIVAEGECLEDALCRLNLPLEFDGLTIARCMVSPG